MTDKSLDNAKLQLKNGWTIFCVCDWWSSFLAASLDLQADMSSVGDEGLEESEWELNSDVAMVLGAGGVSKGSPQAEKEIR